MQALWVSLCACGCIVEAVVYTETKTRENDTAHEHERRFYIVDDDDDGTLVDVIPPP